MDIENKIKNSELKIGTPLMVILKEGAEIMESVTMVDTYYMPEGASEKESNRKYAGFFSYHYKNNDKIRLSLGWDYDKNKIPIAFRTPGHAFYFDSIYSYQILDQE